MSRSIKDYAIYFLTICLAVSMHYAFNSISSQPAMGELSKSMRIWGSGLTVYISYLSKFISIILAALILYANQFILKRRSKELAIYTTLGMPKINIVSIFVGETLLIGAAALVVGIGVGFFLSQALSTLAVQLFAGDVRKFALVFSLSAVKETIITFVIIYLIVALLSVLSITKIKLIDMLKQERTNQEISIGNTLFSVLSFIVSIVCLAISIYLLMTKGIAKDSLMQTIVLLTLGIVLLFYSISTVFTTLAKKSVNFYYKDLNSFLVKQISSKLKVNMWVMVSLTGLLILSITVLGVGFSVTSSLNQKMLNEKVVDLSVMVGSNKGDPEVFLKANGVDPRQYVEKSAVLSTYASPIEYLKLLRIEKNSLSQMDKTILNGTLSLISESDYNKLLSLIGKETIVLDEDEYLINADYDSVLPYYQAMLKEGKEIKLFDKILKNKGVQVLDTAIMTGINRNNPGVLIVDDSLVKGQTVKDNIWNAKMLSNEAEDDFYTLLNDTFLELSLKNQICYSSRLVNENANIGIFGVVAFLCSYLGLILIIVTLSVLALQQLTETQENKMRYLNLTKIGASKIMVQKTVNKQVGVYFIAPLVPALTLSIFVVKAVLTKVEPFFGMKIGMNLVVSVAILLGIYFLYYVVTCAMAHNIIIEKRVNQ